MKNQPYLLLIFMALLLVPTGALGKGTAKEIVADLKSPVVPKGSKTWQEVLSQILIFAPQGADQELKVQGFKPGKEAICDLNEPSSILAIKSLSSATRIDTVIDLADCALLAVFEKTAPYRLVNATYLGLGGPSMGGVEYGLESIHPISPQAQLLWLWNDHENSDESFTSYQLLLEEKGNFKTVYEGPDLYSIKSGAHSHWFEADIQKLPTSRGVYPDFHIVVGQRKKYEGRSFKEYPWTIAWDDKLQKYMGGNKELLRVMKAYNDQNN